MRIRLDGDRLLGVMREARLALQVAGFVLAEDGKDADYVVGLAEAEDRHAPIVIEGADGAFERLAINRFAAIQPRLIVDRSAPPNDQALHVTIPPVDEVRRATCRALVEIFLSFVAGPTAATRITQDTTQPIRPTSPMEQAQALIVPATAVTGPDPTVDLLTRRLVDLTHDYVSAIEAHQTLTLTSLARITEGVAELPTVLADIRADVNDQIAQSEHRIVDRFARLMTPTPPPWWRFWVRRG
jgi:hypothetical protein